MITLLWNPQWMILFLIVTSSSYANEELSVPVDDPSLSPSHNYLDAGRLHDFLLFNDNRPYHSSLIPIKNGQPVPVHLNLYIQEICDFNQKLQTLDVNVWLPIGWYDERLKWDPKSFGNVSDIRVNAGDIWTPDLVLYNPADGRFQTEDEVSRQVFARVFHTGLVRWTPLVKYSISCPLSLKFFPFDVQMCRLQFGSWVHSVERLTLHEYSWNVSNTEFFVDNNIWFMEESKSVFREVVYGETEEQNSETYAEVHFFFMMSRNYQMYFINIVVSATLMAGLCFLSFYVPVGSGERLSLPLSIIIAISVYQLMAAEIIPTGTDTIPILSVFLLSLLILVNCSIIATMLSLKLTHDSKITKPPVWIFIILVLFLGKITNIKSFQEYSDWEKIEIEGDSPTFDKARRPSQSADKILANIGIKNRSLKSNEIGVISEESKEGKTQQQHNKSRRVSIASSILTLSAKKFNKKCVLEWKLIGIMVDRICMSLYVVFLLGSFIWLMIFSNAKEYQLSGHRETIRKF